MAKNSIDTIGAPLIDTVVLPITVDTKVSIVIKHIVKILLFLRLIFYQVVITETAKFVPEIPTQHLEMHKYHQECPRCL